ncbi:MAG: hypothetical protein D6798_20015 [Deltaproteobacteria bacterium]|nr:MAG: hypothetical protein D6798_20015 [Deltaproteobacteria bacterium]
MPACPICKTEMKSHLIDGYQTDICPAHGMWLDKGELVGITEVERQKHGRFEWADLFRKEVRPPRHERRALSCPICGKPTVRELYHDVEIDWCRKHGVWLDKGELDAILNNLRLDPSFLRGIRVRIADTQY